MPTFSTPHDGSATTLTLSLDGVVSTYVVSNIQIAYTNPNTQNNNTTINVAHLGQTTGESEETMDKPLLVPATNGAASGRQITFNYIGKVVIADAATGTYKITVNGVNLVGGSASSYHTVSSSQLTLATQDAIRGQAVLTVAR